MDKSPSPEDTTTLSDLIRLDDCDRTADFPQQVSDYEVNRVFIDVLSDFPDLLTMVIEGQKKARLVTTYDFPPGILPFRTTGHASFLAESLQCIKAVLEFKACSDYRRVAVNPNHLKSFQFNCSTPTFYPTTDENPYWDRLSEKLGVTPYIREQINDYLNHVDANVTRPLNRRDTGPQQAGIFQEA